MDLVEGSIIYIRDGIGLEEIKRSKGKGGYRVKKIKRGINRIGFLAGTKMISSGLFVLKHYAWY